MSSTKHDNGGPAFPLPDVQLPSGEMVWGDPGMSTWNYHAAHAPKPPMFAVMFLSLINRCTEHEAVAQQKALHADAMIAEYRKRWPE